MKPFVRSVSVSVISRKRWVLIGVFSALLLACGEDPKQLYETAQFEEQQHNLTHAQELYERILQDHPDSDYAQKAQQRLEELNTEKAGGRE